MKTVIISCFHNLISRNILSAGVLDHILDGGVRVVILVPSGKREFFQKTYGSETVFIEAVDIPTSTAESIIQFLSLSIAGVNNHIIADLWRDGHRLKYLLAHTINRSLSPFYFSHRILAAVFRRFLRTKVFDEIFAMYDPDLVFVTDCFDRHDRLLLNEAKRNSVPTVGMVRSWDNATSKGVFLAEPNHIIVHNEVLLEEMIAIHHVSSERITVSGVPHYDNVLREASVSRENFFNEVGLDLSKKTVLFAPAGKILYQHDGEILALLRRCLDAGNFGPNVQFLVRFPPGDVGDTSAVEGDERFVIDRPGTKLTKRKKDSEMSPIDNDRLNNSLRYCDIVLTIVSTIAIDGVVFDKPTIVLGFDPLGGLADSIGRFPKEPHFKKFLDTGLVTIAHTEQELGNLITTYLAHPELDSDKRAKIRARYTYRVDGRSSERVANCVQQQLG